MGKHNRGGGLRSLFGGLRWRKEKPELERSQEENQGGIGGGKHDKDRLNPSRRLSENFTLGELVKSDVAVRHGIDNAPNERVLANLERVCVEILQPTRDWLERPVVVRSGYRSPEVNRLVGGAAASRHLFGLAVDFESPGTPNNLIAKWIVDNLEFDKCILEFFDGKDPHSGWIHVSVPGGGGAPLNAALTATRNSDGRVVYAKGIWPNVA